MPEPRTNTNVYPFIPAEISGDLSKFEDSKTLDDFLVVLTKAVQIPSAGQSVFESWRKHHAEVDLTKGWEKVSVWISRLNLRTAKPESVKKDQPSYSSSPVISDIAQAALEKQEQQESREVLIQNNELAYNLFVGAWPFADQLAKFPSIERSAQLINRFMRHIFSGAPEPEHSGSIVVRCGIPELSDFILGDFLPPTYVAERERLAKSKEAAHRGEELIELYMPSLLQLLSGKMNLSDSRTYVAGFTSEGLGSLLPKLPSKLKARLIVQIANDFSDRTLFGEITAPGEAFRHLFAPVLNSADSPATACADMVTALYFGNEFRELGLDFVKKTLTNYLCRMRDLRRAHEGVSPLPRQQADSLCADIGNLASACGFGDVVMIDVALAMAPVTYNAQSGPNLFNFPGVPLDHYGDDPESAGKDRSKWFFRVCESAISEGYSELANSCLAFFLFSQATLFEGRLWADWKMLSELLVKGATMPGNRAVRDAAEIALEIVRRYDLRDGVDALNLEGWSEDSTANDAASIEQILNGVDRYSRAERSLQDAIGRESWIKFSIPAKHALLTAEKSWFALSAEVGYGSNDLGQIAVGYVKAIELELTERCQFLLSSASYDDYCREKSGRGADPHLTLGSVMKVLNNYSRLPVALQSEIEENRITIHQDTGLIKRLMNLKNLRNEGAHSVEVDDQKLVHLRSELFKNGLLKRFIDGL